MMKEVYFDFSNGDFVEEWIFGAAPKELTKNEPKFRTPIFNYTLSYWLNTIIENGFTLEKFDEPYPNDETLKKYPNLDDARIMAYFLIILCRKIK